ncbi:hypothetical protein UFOVP1071_95 [uncultured Caudovirales phage]|uniref:Uncharacterized protein n=1 Tax=uncultured Caudovirales phage TaxID=2100421 RepID=A0A6J5QM90_9CAUD|nr:hypothetical protein UFOVP1071_95 [uncultured Caudovirales phage]
MIKLTNMNSDHLGMPLYIATDKIVAIFEDETDGGGLRTVVMTGHEQFWVVEESLGEVIKFVKEVKNEQRKDRSPNTTDH